MVQQGNNRKRSGIDHNDREIRVIIRIVDVNLVIFNRDRSCSYLIYETRRLFLLSITESVHFNLSNFLSELCIRDIKTCFLIVGDTFQVSQVFK